MATSNLLQCLNEGADFGVSTSARRVVETYIAGETVAVGDAVSLDLSETEDGDKALKVVQSDSGTDTDRAFVGIVLRSAEPSGALTAGARVEVVVGGPAEANVDGATAAGNLLQIGSTAGRLAVREVNVDEVAPRPSACTPSQPSLRRRTWRTSRRSSSTASSTESSLLPSPGEHTGPSSRLAKPSWPGEPGRGLHP